MTKFPIMDTCQYREVSSRTLTALSSSLRLVDILSIPNSRDGPGCTFVIAGKHDHFTRSCGMHGIKGFLSIGLDKSCDKWVNLVNGKSECKACSVTRSVRIVVNWALYTYLPAMRFG